MSFNPISFLFETAYWPQRWNCGYWTDALGWTHIISDIAIFGAYMAIPCAILYFKIKRHDIPQNRIFFLFAAFIILCGAGHLIEATIFYYPVYRFAGLVKMMTALVSWATAIALVPLIPKLLAAPKLNELNEVLEKDLKLERERLNLAFKGLNAGLWEWSPSNQTVWVSRRLCELTNAGQSDQELPFSEFLKLFHPDAQENMKKLLESLEPLDEITQLTDPKDQWHWYSVIGYPRKDEAGESISIVGAITDIEQRVVDEQQREHLLARLERTNSQLEVSNKSLQEFAYFVAHDLKEPVRSLVSHTTILEHEIEEALSEKQRERFQLIHQLGNSANNMIDSLLQLSRETESDQAYGEVDLNALLEEIRTELALYCSERKAEIFINSSLPTVTAERTQLKAVFTNLITNGIKYNTRDKKQLKIGHALTPDAPLTLYVQDNGIGISEVQQTKIFRMFHQVKDPSASDEGHGIGLTIVKKIIEQHGGSIWMESKENEGTKVSFTLTAK